MRSKGFIGLALIALLVFFAGCNGCRVRNSLAGQQEEVRRTWADVESQYQRRASLIPNLVRTVQRAESFDRETISAVSTAEERVRATAGAASSSDAGMREYLAAQRSLGSSLGKLLGETSSSEQLASIDAFRALQDQIEGTENRINVARRDYNAAVSGYNSRIKKFPTNIVALLTGFAEETPFEAESGAEHAPEVDL